MWQENLFNNLLAVIVLGTLVLIVYCKIAKKTLPDLIREFRESMSEPIE